MLKKILQLYRGLPVFKGKLRLGKIFFGSLVNQSLPVEFIAHDNIHYRIPNTLESLGTELFITGMYEKKIANFLKKQIKSDHIYFDLGANIGTLGIPVVKNNPGIKYFGIEASPLVFEYLQFNFNANKIQHFSLHNNIVHEDNNQSMKFYESDQYGKSSLAPTYAKDHILVNSVAIDSFCELYNVQKINWMKIDVQGFELFVFKGMKQLLKDKRIENILFEFEFWAEDEAGLERGAAQKYITGLGYDLYNVDGIKLPGIIKEGRAMIWAKPS